MMVSMIFFLRRPWGHDHHDPATLVSGHSREVTLLFQGLELPNGFAVKSWQRSCCCHMLPLLVWLVYIVESKHACSLEQTLDVRSIYSCFFFKMLCLERLEILLGLSSGTNAGQTVDGVLFADPLPVVSWSQLGIRWVVPKQSSSVHVRIGIDLTMTRFAGLERCWDMKEGTKIPGKWEIHAMRNWCFEFETDKVVWHLDLVTSCLVCKISSQRFGVW